MPLTNNIIIKLNEITMMVQDKNRLTDTEIDNIKQIFENIIKTGERYDVNDIESWFENEGSWHNKSVIVRITNLSHYVQNKYEQTNRFRIISDESETCSCGN